MWVKPSRRRRRTETKRGGFIPTAIESSRHEIYISRRVGQTIAAAETNGDQARARVSLWRKVKFKIPGGPSEAKASAKWVRLRSGTKVGGPKVIRYHRSSDPKRCHPEIRRSASEYPIGHSPRETQRR